MTVAGAVIVAAIIIERHRANLARVMAGVERRFGHRPSADPAAPAPIGSYRADDAQEFIR